MTHNEIILTSVGTLLTAVSYVIGVRQKAKATVIKSNNEAEIKEQKAITEGAEQVVSSAMMIMQMLKTDLEETRLHRTNCENRVATLEKELREIKRKMQKNPHQTR